MLKNKCTKLNSILDTHTLVEKTFCEENYFASLPESSTAHPILGSSAPCLSSCCTNVATPPMNAILCFFPVLKSFNKKGADDIPGGKFSSSTPQSVSVRGTLSQRLLDVDAVFGWGKSRPLSFAETILLRNDLR